MNFLLPLCFFLLSCSTTSSDVFDVIGTIPDVSDQQEVLEIHPSRLDVAHLGTMKLVGSSLTLDTILDSNEAYTRYSITYRGNTLKLSGIMNIPKGDGPFPLLVLNHGYIDPDYYTNGRGLKREQDYFARQGFAVIHPDYRGHAGSDPSPVGDDVYDAGLEYSMDVINAILAVKEADLPQIDTSSIGMLGHSMGGGITLNIATARPDLIDAIVLYAPVHADAWKNFTRWRDDADDENQTRAVLGSRRSNPGNWDRLSSLTYLSSIDDPILNFHGTNDEDVPLEWSETLSTKLDELGKRSELIIYTNEAHEFSFKWNDFMEASTKHFKESLKEAVQSTSIYDINRILYKPFGIKIDKATSPVQPERFSGFHTGVDFELLPGETNLEVAAICSGNIVQSSWVSGYGGVVVQSCTVNNQAVTVLYGHLNPNSLPAVGATLTNNKPFAVTGEGFSTQTDGERPHLHLSIHKGEAINLKGYVQNESEFINWIDPLEVL